jgi:hypothetical protein
VFDFTTSTTPDELNAGYVAINDSTGLASAKAALTRDAACRSTPRYHACRHSVDQ